MENRRIKMFKEYSGYTEFSVGDLVKVASNNDNENYDDFRDKTLRITNVATNTSEHPGYDYSMNGQGLYDLVINETDEEVDVSLYDYELESVDVIQ